MNTSYLFLLATLFYIIHILWSNYRIVRDKVECVKIGMARGVYYGMVATMEHIKKKTNENLNEDVNDILKISFKLSKEYVKELDNMNPSATQADFLKHIEQIEN